MIKRFLKRSAWLVFAALVLAAVVLPSDVYRPNPAQLAAAGYEYSLLEWEAANFFSKWVHRVAQAMPWNGASREERLAQVDEYFRLGQEINGLLRELEQAAAQEGTAGSGRPPDIEARLDELRSRRSQAAERRGGGPGVGYKRRRGGHRFLVRRRFHIPTRRPAAVRPAEGPGDIGLGIGSSGHTTSCLTLGSRSPSARRWSSSFW